MVDGAVRVAPYRAGLSILAWVRSPGVWNELDGDCLRRGVDLRRLSYDRFLNVVYHAMIQRLEVDEKQPDRPRREFDHALEVDAWWLPGVRPRPRRVVDRTAPYWWRGDEDASQSFMQAMGVNT